jgi:hypothetical protein
MKIPQNESQRKPEKLKTNISGEISRPSAYTGCSAETGSETEGAFNWRWLLDGSTPYCGLRKSYAQKLL